MIIKTSQWQRPIHSQSEKVKQQVTDILQTIRHQGDQAIEHFAVQFDGHLPKEIPLKNFDDYSLDTQLKQSIIESEKRIETFAAFQRSTIQEKSFSDDYGEYAQVIHPIENIAAYIPGGRYPLISTALMTLLPAKIAGCKKRIACSPSDHPAILAAASLAGATDFIQIGGTQAIAAMAYGYKKSPPVDLIVGPGNAWVSEAKSQVQSIVKIDGVAGPSELLALCNDQQPVEWLCYDALAQSEHDPMAISIIVSDSESWLQQVFNFLNNLEEGKQLLKHQQVVLLLADSIDEMIQISEQFAPEHLMLCDQRIDKTQLTHYGSLFIGSHSAVAYGDYCTGPNHTLPTSGFARQSGGLSVHTFLRLQTQQCINHKGRQALAQMALPVSEAEGLKQHSHSMIVRLNQ